MTDEQKIKALKDALQEARFMLEGPAQENPTAYSQTFKRIDAALEAANLIPAA